MQENSIRKMKTQGTDQKKQNVCSTYTWLKNCIHDIQASLAFIKKVNTPL